METAWVYNIYPLSHVCSIIAGHRLTRFLMVNLFKKDSFTDNLGAEVHRKYTCVNIQWTTLQLSQRISTFAPLASTYAEIFFWENNLLPILCCNTVQLVVND